MKKHKTKKRSVKILYLYDFKDWAIHNVGLLWLSGLRGFTVDFKQYTHFRRKMHKEYDLIWFGYSDLFFYHMARLNVDLQYKKKYILVIHDPLEIFPQVKYWKAMNIDAAHFWNLRMYFKKRKLKILRKMTNIATTSRELQSILHEHGVKTHVLPTTSFLPKRSRDSIKSENCRILSVYEEYPRKNIQLLKEIQNYFANSKTIIFHEKVGKKILPQGQYIKLLDNHEIYICTSFQEGGPIPVMDAMQRGAVVLTTPVGQVQEMIQNGKNGFICRTKADFIKKISLLSENMQLMQKMRLHSLERITKQRNVIHIKNRVCLFLEGALYEKEHVSQEEKKSIVYFVNYLANILWPEIVTSLLFFVLLLTNKLKTAIC